MELVKGHRGRVDQLTSATTLELGVTLAGPSTYDVSLFALDADGRLSDDAYLVFYNQPASPDGSLRVAARADGGDFTVDLSAVPGWIHRLVLTVAIDGTGTMAQLGQGRIAVRAGGQEVAGHTTTGADYAAERALMLIELYRKDGWRLTVVDQGFDGGMAALVRHFGGEVDDAPAAPPPPPAAPPPAAAPPAPAVNLGKVTLDKGRVSLAKNQTVSLAKGGKPVLSKVAMGLGWDPATAGSSIDLDASCLVMDANGEKLDMVWFVAKSGAGGAVVHSGDNLTGAGEGDDEVITVDLGQVPPAADVLLFTVNSYKRHPFTQVVNAYCRLFDVGTGDELVHFALTGSEPRTGVFMVAIFRSGAGWDMTALGVFEDGRTVREMVGPAKAVLATLDRT
ncbi:MAG TPA: TerD family protein [Iamia sp.]|jgi:stress response protein SCP2|nr:TerD family protein [Iamia sp.]